MTVEIICADAREALGRFSDGWFHTVITSPPYLVEPARLRPGADGLG